MKNKSEYPFLGASVRCYVDGRAHLNVKQNVDPDELTYQKSLLKKKRQKLSNQYFFDVGIQHSSFECRISSILNNEYITQSKI